MAVGWDPGGGCLVGHPWGHAGACVWTLRAHPPGAAVGHSLSCAFLIPRALGKVSPWTDSCLTLAVGSMSISVVSLGPPATKAAVGAREEARGP